jgi:hypothetical protein
MTKVTVINVLSFGTERHGDEMAVGAEVSIQYLAHRNCSRAWLRLARGKSWTF